MGWFDQNARFQARGYVYEQDDRDNDLSTYITPIDDIEKRTGLDFFPILKDLIEDLIEGTGYADFWGAE